LRGVDSYFGTLHEDDVDVSDLAVPFRDGRESPKKLLTLPKTLTATATFGKERRRETLISEVCRANNCNVKAVVLVYLLLPADSYEDSVSIAGPLFTPLILYSFLLSISLQYAVSNTTEQV
jgi:hypothetical protein